MIDFTLAILGVLAGAALFSTGLHFLRFWLKRAEVVQAVVGMEAGIYVEHGMTIDPATGLVSPQQRPSTQAYRHLV